MRFNKLLKMNISYNSKHVNHKTWAIFIHRDEVPC